MTRIWLKTRELNIIGRKFPENVCVNDCLGYISVYGTARLRPVSPTYI